MLRSRSRFCRWSEPKAGAAPDPAASLRQAKMKNLVLVSNLTLRAVYNGKYDPKKTVALINYLRA